MGGSLQDAFTKGYDCVLLSDGAATTSPMNSQESIEFNCAKTWGFAMIYQSLWEGATKMVNENWRKVVQSRCTIWARLRVLFDQQHAPVTNFTCDCPVASPSHSLSTLNYRTAPYLARRYEDRCSRHSSICLPQL